MNRESTHIDNLIARALTGEASPEEWQELSAWMENSPENKKYFEGIRFVNDKVVASYPYIRVDVDKAWTRMNSSMTGSDKSRIVPIHKKSWMLVAASMAVLIVLSVLLYFLLLPSINVNKTISRQSAGTITVHSLANIGITLNRHSKVTVASKKGGREKYLELTGEAFFQVDHAPDTIMIVKAGETFIRDIGTSFNVQAYTDSTTVDVYVTSGEVIFYTENDEGIHIKAGETGIFDKVLKEFRKKEKSDLNSIAYQSKLFVFQDTPLNEIITVLNRVYEERFEVDPRISGHCNITVTFSNESPRAIAEILAETLGLELTGNDTAFILKGESCSGQP